MVVKQIPVCVRGMRVAIIMAALIFTMNLSITTLGLLVSGKQFIYNLSQMDYPEAYRVVQNIALAHLHEIPPEHARLINEEMIRSELDRYLKSAEELNEAENIILNLSNRSKSGAINTYFKTSTAVLIALLIWHELWRAKRQEEVGDN